MQPIVTQGFGSSPMILTLGFGGIPVTPPTPSAVVKRKNQVKGRRPEIEKILDEEEYKIFVMLTTVNKKDLEKPYSVTKKYVVKDKNYYIKASAEKLIYRKPRAYKIVISEIKVTKGDD